MTSLRDLKTALDHACIDLGNCDVPSKIIVDRTTIDSDCRDILDMCDTIQGIVSSLSSKTTRLMSEVRPLSSPEMIHHVGRAIRESQEKMKADQLPGGAEMKSLRRTRGKCELCGSEYKVSPHHVIPRSEGGLDDEDNIVNLCCSCHDEAEGMSFTNRNHFMSHFKSLIGNKQKGPSEESRKKAQETRAANEAERRRFEADLVQWDKWTHVEVPFLRLGEPEPPRPEKPWHLWVYGGGRQTRTS